MTVPTLSVPDALAVLHRGGVIAYPTEAVWGLGCDPFSHAAVERVLALKQRPVEKGLIVVAAAVEQLASLVDWDALPPARFAEVRASWPGPHTWVMPATAHAPGWITGVHAGIAVRVSAHPVVAALCAGFGGPLVSTSANPAGAPPPSERAHFDDVLAGSVDAFVDGVTGGLDRPTVIRDACTGEALRL